MTPLTSELEWLDALDSTPSWQPSTEAVVVVSPHPDDEVLGSGGFIAERSRNGLSALVIAVTDGEAAYPGVAGLASLRQWEQEKATARLGVPRHNIVRLGIPDAQVSSSENYLVERLLKFLTPDTLLIAPWEFDPHPDHEACGRASARAVEIVGCRLLSYFFWTWHRFRPSALESLNLRRFHLDPELLARKNSALSEYRSQLEWSEPILPPALLAPARRTFETFALNDAA